MWSNLTVPQRDSDPIAAYVRNNVSFVVTIVPFAVAALRLVRVSGLDPAVLAVLLETVDFVALFIGTTLVVLPAILAYLISIWLLIRQSLLPSQERRMRYRISFLVTVFGFFLVVFLSPGLVIGVAFLWGVSWFLEWFFRRRGETESWSVRRARERNFIRAQLHTLTGFVALIIFMPSQLWLAPHSVSVDNNVDVVYILKSDEITTTVLSHDTNEIKVVATDEITESHPCSVTSDGWSRILGTPVLFYFFGDDVASLPQCP
jgi:hypothetical protein